MAAGMNKKGLPLFNETKARKNPIALEPASPINNLLGEYKDLGQDITNLKITSKKVQVKKSMNPITNKNLAEEMVNALEKLYN